VRVTKVGVMRSYLMIGALCVLLCTLGEKGKAQQPNKERELINAETELMSDPQRAGPVLEERLAQRVKVDSGVIMIDVGGFFYVLPTSTSWTLECFNGMSIIFGNSVTNDVSRGDSNKDFESRTSNDVVVLLSVGSISPENCKILAPRVGKRLLTMLGQGH